MDFVTLKENITEVCQSVDGIGNFYGNYKFATDWSKFMDQFKYTDLGITHFRGGWLQLPTSSYLGQTSTWDDICWFYDFPIRLFMSLSDRYNSEQVFGELLFRTRDVLYSQTTMGMGSTGVVPGSVNCTVYTVDIRQFASNLVHFAQLNLSLEVHENLPTEWGP